MLYAEKPKDFIKNINSTPEQVEGFRNSAYSINNGISKELVTVREYREILNDNDSSDEQVQKRIQYLEALCQNIISSELQKLRVISTKANE